MKRARALEQGPPRSGSSAVGNYGAVLGTRVSLAGNSAKAEGNLAEVGF